MDFATVDPTSGALVRRYARLSDAELEAALRRADRGQREWSRATAAERCDVVAALGRRLRERRRALAETVALEMGKPIREALAEVEKCAQACDHYARNGEEFLADSVVPTESHRSYVTLQPQGLVLAIMPWNFPLWQVVRAAVPALLGGNGVLLKHAPNVPRAALDLVDLFESAGVPDGAFTNLFVDPGTAADVIRDARVRCVSFTGSTRAGAQVAAVAGAAVKPCVLELGGSDPYVVLEDADIERAAGVCVSARLLNAGQSCIAPKRLIVHADVARDFTERVLERLERVRMGDPTDPETDMGPLARQDLRDRVADQVERSVAAGARCVLGGAAPRRPGWHYPPTALTGVAPGTAAYEEEVFGPVFSIVEAQSEEEAVRIANDTRYGLGAAVFTRDVERGERIARREITAGTCVVNDFARSDPRLPFGGVKDSGFGRELSSFGVLAFVNVKTVRVER